jgi:hypothetical protein
VVFSRRHQTRPFHHVCNHAPLTTCGYLSGGQVPGSSDKMSYCAGLGLPHERPYVLYKSLSSNRMIHDPVLTDARPEKVGQSCPVDPIRRVQLFVRPFFSLPPFPEKHLFFSYPRRSSRYNLDIINKVFSSMVA